MLKKRTITTVVEKIDGKITKETTTTIEEYDYPATGGYVGYNNGPYPYTTWCGDNIKITGDANSSIGIDTSKNITLTGDLTVNTSSAVDSRIDPSKINEAVKNAIEKFKNMPKKDQL